MYVFDPVKLILFVSTVLNIFFYWKIAKRFRRSGAHALWLIFPFFGAFYFWSLLATQPVAKDVKLEELRG